MNELERSSMRKLCYLLAAILIGIALLVSTVRLLTPLLDQHRADFEKWASQVLSVPVSIGQARVTWYRYDPGVSLNEVTVYDKEHLAPILQIKKVRIFFSIWQSLWHRKPMLSGVMLSGSNVNVVKAQGQISIQGFPVFSGLQAQPFQHQTNATELMAWLSTGSRLFLRDIDVHYVGELGQKRFVTLYNLTLVNSSTNHHAYGKAILHQTIPTELTLAGDWQGNVTDLNSIKVDGYLYLSGLSLSQWFSGFNWRTWKVKDGLGSAKIWASWESGSLNKVQTEFQLYNVGLESSKDHTVHQINRLSGHVGWMKQDGKQIIAGEDILLDLPAHLWPATDFRLVLKQDSTKAWAPRKFFIEYVDLDDLKPFLTASDFLTDAQLKQFLALQLSGTLLDTKIVFGASLEDFSSIQFESQLSHFGAASYQSFPSVGNLTAKVRWDGKEGKIVLNSLGTHIDYPQIFANKLFFDQISGDFSVHHDMTSQQWMMNIQSFRLQNEDLTLSASGTLAFDAKLAPTSNITADFVLKDARHAIQYLPQKTFDSELNHWLSQAFLSGMVDSGKAILRGPLVDFPFDKSEGQFLIEGNVNQVDLRYAPDWPLLNNISAKLVFNNRKVLIDVNKAETVGIPIGRIHAEIPSLGDTHDAWLNIDVTPIQTDLGDGLQIIKQSPLKKTIGKMFSTMNATGPMTLKLNLQIPLKNPDNTKVNGDVVLTDAVLDFPPWNLSLKKLNGAFNFTDKTMNAAHLQGDFFDKPLTLQLTTLTKNTSRAVVRAIFSGTITTTDIENWLKISLKDHAAGVTPFTGNIDLALDQPILAHIQSDLQGIAISSPQFFVKSAKDRVNLALDITAADNKPLQLQATYGNAFKAGLTLGQSTWDIQLGSQFASGRISVPAHFAKNGLITAQLDRLEIPASSSKDKINLDINPASLPPLLLTINNLRYGNLFFSRINAKTMPISNGLQIQSFALNTPNLQVNGTGQWTNVRGNHKTQLNGEGKSNNVSQLLSGFGFDMHNIVMSAGKFSANLSWPGVPYMPSFDAMNGKAKLELGQGRIVEISQSSNAKMDLGRMLNIFSLQSIPRRLSLDFSDVTQKGYSFDSLKGDLEFNDGDLYTSNAAFDGPIARIGISGRIGIAEKDYDLTLSVTPYVTSSIPVAATLLTGQPVIGLAALVVNKVLSPAVSNVTTYYYSVRGPWSNPSWDSISVPKKK